ncbi:hypothetical protein HYT53_00795 [Candidatus Woesearchaeota archaeon]|nr:hypothetical protein [Candidatus Woesearchaeota archaeon]
MRDKKLFRLLIIALIVFLVLNIVFLSLKIISEFFFWIVIIVIGIFAYKYLPKMRK